VVVAVQGQTSRVRELLVMLVVLEQAQLQEAQEIQVGQGQMVRQVIRAHQEVGAH
jgi:hypothetical protein